MKRSVMRKWVAALTSGKYKQTTGTLKGEYFFGVNKDGTRSADETEGTGYCCLGVLCALKAKECHKSFNTVGQGDSMLPTAVMEWAGMRKSNGQVKGKKINLVTLNDTEGFTFKQIAKFIRDNYKAL